MRQRLNARTVFAFLIMLLPMMGFAQAKNVTSATRVFPKMDKVVEFEKALVAHIQKYHTADYRWRVFAIQSGPDAGGYHIVEGPDSWEGIDKRGEIGAEHTLDWNKNVAVHLADRMQVSYSVFQESLSTVALGDYSDKINITHVYPKVGQTDHVGAILKRLKKTWEASGSTVAVYMGSSSGPAQYAVVTRYKQGLKEREAGFRKPLKELYETAYGEGSYAQYLKDVSEHVQESWSELLSFRKDLSSK
jgi:hypothetical protein